MWVLRSGTSPGVASSGLVSGIDVDGGKVRVVSVVAVAKGERGVISPCGRCRQVMLDYHPWIRVIVRTGEGVGEEGLETVGLGELLPFAYVGID
jgi:cytidine deaminase